MSALQRYKIEAKDLQEQVDALEIENGRLKDFARLLLLAHKADIGAPYLEQERALTLAFPKWQTPEFAEWLGIVNFNRL
jgi:hypothetical protein